MDEQIRRYVRLTGIPDHRSHAADSFTSDKKEGAEGINLTAIVTFSNGFSGVCGGVTIAGQKDPAKVSAMTDRMVGLSASEGC